MNNEKRSNSNNNYPDETEENKHIPSNFGREWKKERKKEIKKKKKKRKKKKT